MRAAWAGWRPINPEDTVALNFPNASRSHDAARQCVRFWGHDNSREIAFVVEHAVLARFDPGIGSDERAVLDAFDRHRERIIQQARDLYDGGARNAYIIS
jgi:hypothetical protein